MGFQPQSSNLLVPWVLYGLHWIGIPIWLATAIHEIKRQRRRIVSEWEYFGVRFLITYVFFDALRAFDQCFDSSDGVWRAIWGVNPLSMRLAAWCARDACLLIALSFYLDFTVGWTHSLLGLPVPKRLCIPLWIMTFLAISNFAGCCIALTVTNRQSWPVFAGSSMIILNLSWMYVNASLLSKVFPNARAYVGFGASCQNGSAGTPDGTGIAKGVFAKAQFASRLILAANIGILVAFPSMIVERIWFDDAHAKPLIPSVGVANWAVFEVSPKLESIPSGVAVRPLLEILELCIGWMQCAYCAVAIYTDEDLSILVHDEADKVCKQYISRDELGRGLRKIAGKKD